MESFWRPGLSAQRIIELTQRNAHESEEDGLKKSN